MRILSSTTWAILGLYRLALLGLIEFILLQHHHLPLGVPGVRDIIGLFMALVLGVGVWGYKAHDHRGLLQVTMLIIDVFIMTLLLVRFSNPDTLVPVCLPLLAYEAGLYWYKCGIIMGGLAGCLMLVNTWWLRLWSHNQPWPMINVAFWSVFLLVVVLIPMRFFALPLGSQPQRSDTPCKRDSADTTESLTAREQEIHTLIQSGISLRQIARQLHVSYSTAKTHARNIAKKLPVGKRQREPLSRMIHSDEEPQKSSQT